MIHGTLAAGQHLWLEFAQLFQVSARAQQKHATVPEVTAAVDIGLGNRTVGLLDKGFQLVQVGPQGAATADIAVAGLGCHGHHAKGHQSPLLRQGQSLDEGTPDELRGRFPLQVFEVAVRPLARAARALEPVPGVIEVAPFGDRLHVTVAPGGPGAEAVRAHLQARGTAVQSIEPARPSMEDVFLYLARRP